MHQRRTRGAHAFRQRLAGQDSGNGSGGTTASGTADPRTATVARATAPAITATAPVHNRHDSGGRSGRPARPQEQAPALTCLIVMTDSGPFRQGRAGRRCRQQAIARVGDRPGGRGRRRAPGADVPGRAARRERARAGGRARPIRSSCRATSRATSRSTRSSRRSSASFGGLDFVVHGVAFAERDDLSRPFSETSREGFRKALDVSAYSLIALVAAGRAAHGQARRRQHPDAHVSGQRARASRTTT